MDATRARAIAQRCAALAPKRIQSLLHEHRIRRLSSEEVLCALRAPSLLVAPGVVEAATEHIALLLPRLRLVHSQGSSADGQRLRACHVEAVKLLARAVCQLIPFAL